MVMTFEPEQSLSAFPNFVPGESFCSSSKEEDEKEEVEEWAEIDLDLWHFDLEREVTDSPVREVSEQTM